MSVGCVPCIAAQRMIHELTVYLPAALNHYRLAVHTLGVAVALYADACEGVYELLGRFSEAVVLLVHGLRVMSGGGGGGWWWWWWWRW